MKRLVLACISLLLLFPYGETSRRHPKSCGEIALSSLFASLLFSLLFEVGSFYHQKRKDKSNKTNS